MKLQIFNPTEDKFLKVIEWNHEEIKQEIVQKVEHYKKLVYTENQIKEAKLDRAKLNKFITALESKRKEVKVKCLEPYEAFEKQMKEIITIVNEPITLIDKQIKEVEESKRKEKKAKILEYFEQNIKELKGILSFEKVFKPEYLNVTKSLKSIEEEIKKKIENVLQDIEMIEKLNTKYELQVKDYYIRTLDLSMALCENTRLLELEEKEYIRKEAKMKEKDKIRQPIKLEAENIEMKNLEKDQALIEIKEHYKVGLNIVGIKEELDVFCEFLNNNNIWYEVTMKPQLVREGE